MEGTRWREHWSRVSCWPTYESATAALRRPSVRSSVHFEAFPEPLQFGPTGGLRLPVYAPQVPAHGITTYEQEIGNLAVAVTGFDQAQDFGFPRGEVRCLSLIQFK